MKYEQAFATLLAFIPLAAKADVIAGPITNPANGHVYYLLDSSSWTAAEAEAVRMGGHLATVRNASENRWLARTFATTPRRSLWIGLHRPPSRGVKPPQPFEFIWSDGSPTRYRLFGKGEPNGERVPGLYVHTFDHDINDSNFGEWNDSSNGDTNPPHYGVVEVIPTPISAASVPEVTSKLSTPTTQTDGIAQINKALALKVAAAQDTYQDQVSAARRERVDALKVLFDQAMASKNLDGALALRNMIRAAEDGMLQDRNSAASVNPTLTERVTLDGFLPGTAWEWGGGTPESKRWNDGRIVFEADGTVTNPNWQGQGQTHRWEVIDRRTILLTFTGGRETGVFAVLRFTEGLDSYTGVGQNGDTLPVNRRVP
jgi:Lectin C-type domain